MNINLHIERLVLDGVNIAPGQRYLLQAGVEGELTRMLKEGGGSLSLAEGTNLSQLFAKGIHITDNNPIQIGLQIAQSVYGGISK